jgi:hypothetical protein
MNRRVVALLTGALAMLVSSVPPASGATPSAARAPTAPAGSTAPAIAADALHAAPAAGASLGPDQGFAVTLDAGGSSSQSLAVGNHSTDRRLTVRVEPVDATTTNAGPRYATSASATGTGSWVTASIGQLVLEPGATTNVPLTVSVPDAAAAGDRAVAGVHVFVTRADPVAGGAPVVDHLPARYVPVNVTVAGRPAAQLTITAVQAQQQGTRSFLAITVRNAGAIAANAVGSAQASGSTLRRAIKVTVEARKERKVVVDWPAIDAATGANVDIELDYAGGNTASWIGNVAPPAEQNVSTPSGATTNTGAAPNAAASKDSWLRTAVTMFVVVLLLAAGAWLVLELVRGRGRPPQRIPVDVASLPPLHVTMDPAHTEVLNALVTQVGVLGSAIERLGDRVGVPVAVPPGPPLLTPQTRRRRRGHTRAPAALEEPVVVAPPAAPAAPAVRVVTRPAPPVAAPAPAPSPAPVRQLEHDDIVAATSDLAPDPPAPAPAPAFIAPPPVGEDGWPTDQEVEAFLERRRARGGDDG